MKGQTNAILAIILTIIIAVFAVTNVESVRVNYFFWTAESPLILVILFSVLMGGIIVAIAGTIRIYRLQKELKALRLQNETMHKEMQELGVPANIEVKNEEEADLELPEKKE